MCSAENTKSYVYYTVYIPETCREIPSIKQMQTCVIFAHIYRREDAYTHTHTHTHTHGQIHTHKATNVLMANKYKAFIPDLSHPLQ